VEATALWPFNFSTDLTELFDATLLMFDPPPRFLFSKKRELQSHQMT
jgi:hypothetical protein